MADVKAEPGATVNTGRHRFTAADARKNQELARLARKARDPHQALDENVRMVACPHCYAQPQKRCDGDLQNYSHIARYFAAYDEGLVPMFPGGEAYRDQFLEPRAPNVDPLLQETEHARV